MTVVSCIIGKIPQSIVSVVFCSVSLCFSSRCKRYVTVAIYC